MQDLRHVVRLHALLFHPSRHRRIGPATTHADLHKVGPTDITALHEFPHLVAVVHDMPVRGRCRVTVSIQLNDTDFPRSIFLRDSGDDRAGDGVVATEKNGKDVGIEYFANKATDIREGHLRITGHDLGITVVGHGKMLESVDPDGL